MNILEIKHLTTSYTTTAGSIKAIEDVSLNLEQGRCLGVAGESGCGKTTLALAIMRLLPSNGKVEAGQVIFKGKNILETEEKDFRKDVSWKEISCAFQGSMNALNPLQKISDQISEAIILHEKISKEDAFKRTAELLETLDISSKRMDDYPFELSGGMKQRVMIAMSLACHPSLVILDEPITALDVIVGAHLMDLVKKLHTEMNLSTILISHSLAVIAEQSDSVAILYAGQLVEYADAPALFESPAHPYSRALINSYPSLHGDRAQMTSLRGSVPNLELPPSGCRFHPRCPRSCEECRKKEPQLIEVSKNHFVRCWNENRPQ